MTPINEENEDRPRFVAYAAMGLFAGAVVAPALWIGPIVLQYVFSGRFAVSPIVTSWSQFAAILVLGLVVGPLVTSALWLFARLADAASRSHRTRASPPPADGGEEP